MNALNMQFTRGDKDEEEQVKRGIQSINAQFLNGQGKPPKVDRLGVGME